jgi:signal transduction histidine kinase
VGNEILGLLDVQQAPPKRLTQRDIQLVSAVADQLAVALQKANLYADLQAALQMEKAIRKQLVQTERLTVMGRLLATVSHELNNPLQAMQNALFLLKEETGISPQGRQDLEIVLAEAERMASLLERLRAAYRPMQADDFNFAQINEIVADVYALIAAHLRHHQIVFEFHPDPDLPPIPLLEDQIRQVLLNLLMNAAESMETGGVLIVCTELSQEADEILLTVKDTGVGISPAILPNIFEAFVTNKPGGTGLGLTISYDIINQHKGRIAAENNPERGATFKVWLPIRQDIE